MRGAVRCATDRVVKELPRVLHVDLSIAIAIIRRRHTHYAHYAYVFSIRVRAQGAMQGAVHARESIHVARWTSTASRAVVAAVHGDSR